MDLSIIIVNYKTPELLLRCMDSIVNTVSKNIMYEIIVVDNYSNDNSKKLIENSQMELTWIQKEENDGFGRANNIGIKQSSGEYILLLNSDMVIMKKTIESCLDKIKSDKNIGALGCKLLNYDGSDQRSVYFDVVSFKSIINQNVLFQKLFGRLKEKNEVKAIMGSFMLTQRKVLDDVGVFDPDFFMYFEEIDLCRRISRFGYDIVFFDEAIAYHKHGASSGDSLWRNRQIYLSQALIVYKDKGLFGYFLYHFLFLINIFLNTIVSIVLKKEYKKNIYESQMAYIANFYRYLLLPFQFSRKIGDGLNLLISK